MLSPEILSGNLEALTRAQGTCPALGALSDSMRVAITGNSVNVEMRSSTGEWRPVDIPTSTSGPHWLDGPGAGKAQMILVGAGLGYALDRAQQLGFRKVVAVEPDPGLATLLLSRQDWRQMFANGNLRLLVVLDQRHQHLEDGVPQPIRAAAAERHPIAIAAKQRGRHHGGERAPRRIAMEAVRVDVFLSEQVVDHHAGAREHVAASFTVGERERHCAARVVDHAEMRGRAERVFRAQAGDAPFVEQRRDFVSVHDVVQACCLALEVPEADGRVFNVGSGRSVSVLDVAAIVGEALGVDLRPDVTEKGRVGDIRHCFADISLARRVLGYEPRVRMEDGVMEVAEWVAGEAAVDSVQRASAELAARGLTI